MSTFESFRLNGVARIEKTYKHIYKDTNKHTKKLTAEQK